MLPTTPMSARSESEREKLRAQCGPVFWSDLAAHAKRGALVEIDPSLDLLDLAVAFANDDAPRVKSLLEQGLVRRPSPERVEAWSRETDSRWDAVVVAPMVLVRERAR